MAVVASFDECLFDPDIVTAGNGSAEFANTIIRNPLTGIYKVNINRFDPAIVATVDAALLDDAQRDYLERFWRGGYGSAYGFRVRWWADWKTQDEVIGTGNGSQTAFSLIKTYSRPGIAGHSDVRRIVKPVVVPSPLGSSVTLYEPDGVTPRVIEIPFVIELDGTPTSAYTVNNTTGVVTMNAAPANGVVVSWTGQFDTPMRFLTNSFNHRLDVASEAQGLPLVEILPAELGIT